MRKLIKFLLLKTATLTARISERYDTVGDLNRTATPRESYRKRSDEKAEKALAK